MAAQNLGVKEALIYTLLQARGVHFSNAPNGWSIGAAIGLLKTPKSKRIEPVIILPEGALPGTIAHEIQASLMEINHPENLLIDRAEGNLKRLPSDLYQKVICFATCSIFKPVFRPEMGVLDRRADSGNRSDRQGTQAGRPQEKQTRRINEAPQRTIRSWLEEIGLAAPAAAAIAKAIVQQRPFRGEEDFRNRQV
jgi:hypothetical protein